MDPSLTCNAVSVCLIQLTNFSHGIDSIQEYHILIITLPSCHNCYVPLPYMSEVDKSHARPVKHAESKVAGR